MCIPFSQSNMLSLVGFVIARIERTYNRVKTAPHAALCYATSLIRVFDFGKKTVSQELCPKNTRNSMQGIFFV